MLRKDYRGSDFKSRRFVLLIVCLQINYNGGRMIYVALMWRAYLKFVYRSLLGKISKLNFWKQSFYEKSLLKKLLNIFLN